MHIPELVRNLESNRSTNRDARDAPIIAKAVEDYCNEETLCVEDRAAWCKSLGEFLSQVEEAGIQSESCWTCGPGWDVQLLHLVTEDFASFRARIESHLHPAVLAWLDTNGHRAFQDKLAYRAYQDVLRWFVCGLALGLIHGVQPCPKCSSPRRIQAGQRGEWKRLLAVCVSCGRENDCV